MAIEILNRSSRHVTTYVPDEKETQTLGGSQTHASAGINLFQTLRTYAVRLGVLWLVRFEAEFHYPRANGTTGIFYPDVFMVPEVDLDDQEPYDVSVGGRPPALVVEIASKKTVHRDVGPKLLAYAEMGVEEYLTFDPRRGKRLALHGYRLAGSGQYREIPPSTDGSLWLSTVGLRVRAEAPTTPFRGPLLRLTTHDGERLLHSYEEAEAREDAELARDAAEQAREAAEQALKTAEEGWDAERRAREAAQAEIARLRALLGESAPES
jgi:Uma2 family endonuclease